MQPPLQNNMALPKNATFKVKAEYIWDYYKWHIAAAVLIAAAVSHLLFSYFNKKDFDFEIIYSGTSYYASSAEAAIASLASEGPDVNGDGEKTLHFDQFSYNDIQSPEYKMTMSVTLQNIVAGGKAKMLWLDYERATALTEAMGDYLVPASLYTPYAEEDALCVSVSESRLLSEKGINADGLYLALIKADSSDSEAADGILKLAEKICEK